MRTRSNYNEDDCDPVRVIEDTDDHRIWTDELGRTLKLPKGFALLENYRYYVKRVWEIIESFA